MSLDHKEPRYRRGARALLLAALLGASAHALALDAAPEGINVVIIRSIDGLFPKISESPEWKRVYYDRANGHRLRRPDADGQHAGQ